MAESSADRFADTFAREHATTVRVLRAFPADQGDFRPHERSSTATQVAATFVAECRMMLAAIRAESIMGSVASATPPASFADAADTFERLGQEVASEARRRGAALEGESVRFFTAPRQMSDIPTMDFLWNFLFDQIHHRGQLSVYVRMTGGRVPSIYGPTADEPWT